MSTLLILISKSGANTFVVRWKCSFWGSYNSPTAWFIICGDMVVRSCLAVVKNNSCCAHVKCSIAALLQCKSCSVQGLSEGKHWKCEGQDSVHG